MKKIVLQRDCQLAIDADSNLYYRTTRPENDEYGDWNDWESESEAVKFVFGDLPVTENLLFEFKKVCQKAPEVIGENFNYGGY